MVVSFHLYAAFDLLRNLHNLHEPKKIYKYLLEEMCNILDAEAGSVFEMDGQKENLALAVSVGPKSEALQKLAHTLVFPVGKGIPGWVAMYNQPTLVEDTRKSSRFNPNTDKLLEYKTRTIICAPLAGKDVVLGVVELLNKKSLPFNKSDLDLLNLVAKQAGIALQNARLYHELTEERTFNDSMLSNLSGGLVAVNHKGIVVRMNAAAERILSLTAEECLGKSLSDVLGHYPLLSNEIVHALENKERKLRQEIECLRYDNVLMKIGYSTFLVQDRPGNLLGAGMIFQKLNQN